jgi:lysophospholipase L1-like esterase
MNGTITRPVLILWLAIAPLTGGTARSADADLRWHEVVEPEGKGWADTKARFDRFPRRAESTVRPPVWSLSQNSAGLAARFVTDAATISVRWGLRGDRLAMPHMAATGVSGVDLYARGDDRWHFLGVGQPRGFPDNESVLVRDLSREEREYRLYLPLYNGVTRVDVGVPAGSSFRFIASDPAARPVVFYGTSITQGGCASRPGMAYPAILGRRLGVEAINLGFSGNGKTEPEVAELLAELQPAAYVLDSLPNLEPAQVAERLPSFLETIRKRHPTIPIVLVENLVYADAGFVARRESKVRDANDALRSIYVDRVTRGDRHLYYVPARDLIGPDGEATVDGTHPTDLGFLRMADALEPALRQALRDAGHDNGPGVRSLP